MQAAHSAGVIDLNWERMRSITNSQTAHEVQEYAEQHLQEHHQLVNRVSNIPPSHTTRQRKRAVWQ